MSHLKICRICLRTEARGYQFDRLQLKYYYEEVIATKVYDDGLPQWFCYECATILHKFHKFKEKCYIGQNLLKDMLRKGPVTYGAIYKMNVTVKPQPILNTITVNGRIKTYNIVDSKCITECEEKESIDNIFTNKVNTEEKEIKMNINTNETFKSGDNVTIFQNDNINSESLNPISVVAKEPINNILIEELKTEEKIVKVNIEIDESFKSDDNIENSERLSPILVVVDSESNIVELDSEDINKIKTKDIDARISLREFDSKYVNEDNWKIVNLTEDKALMEFRAKAEDPKYLNATYKCTDCFKGFSKGVMLDRHIKSRHSESLGVYECRMCRARFKWQCQLRRHAQTHYTKYECRRCHVVCQLETSVILHDTYHSGATKKCVYCNEEFRHVTTYYSHVRSHRSGHVCRACGAAFVSEHGVTAHRARHHTHEYSSSDEGGATYCEKCDIRFDNSRAFDEHLFHSNNHADYIKKEEDETPTKKILGKRLRDKITKELKKRNDDSEPVTVKIKRRKKTKREHRKPSTCYQCGAVFSSQAACMQHHVARHPRTSYHPPHSRHVCELCGASLAPGSVAVHQNMHSREKIHTCDTCGRQFHSSVGLKRHLVTHTGEKPFACPLCPKRFTQSNSMKLHYRTYHLKQPYPKRIRKKKKEPPIRNDSSFESGSVPEAAELPEVPSAATGNVHIVENVPLEDMSDENMHYLTLN